MSHKKIAILLQEKEYAASPWWAQSITVEYEYARDKRTVGQIESAGFEIGAQKTIPLPTKQVWDFLTSSEGLHIWLGNTDQIHFKKGSKYMTKDDTKGEIRSVDKDKKIRLTWKPTYLASPSTVQLYLMTSSRSNGKISIRIHQEKLSTAQEYKNIGKKFFRKLNNLPFVVHSNTSYAYSTYSFAFHQR